MPCPGKELQLGVVCGANNKMSTACCTRTEGAWALFSCTLAFSLVKSRCGKPPFPDARFLHPIWVTVKVIVWIALSSLNGWLTKGHLKILLAASHKSLLTNIKFCWWHESVHSTSKQYLKKKLNDTAVPLGKDFIRVVCFISIVCFYFYFFPSSYRENRSSIESPTCFLPTHKTNFQNKHFWLI